MTSDFKHPETYLAQASARDLAVLVSVTADLALVVNSENVIKDVSHNLDTISGADVPAWQGLPIERTVRVDSRNALRKALGVARSGARGDRFEVNHLIEGRSDLPVQYSAMGIGSDGSIMLMGRDLRIISELQSRLLSNRQTLEQNAKSKKQAEAQYRVLFETASEAIVIVDAATGKIREANPRASRLLNATSAGVSGRKFLSFVDKTRLFEVQSLLSTVVASGRSATMEVDLADAGAITFSAELFRAGDLKLVLVRFYTPTELTDPLVSMDAGIATLVRSAAEAVVLTDADGAVAWANESFLALADIPLAAQALGRPMEDFFLWSGPEQDMLFKNIRRHGRVSAFAATVKGANGQATPVDLSAVAMTNGATPGYGFVMRALGADAERHGRGNSDLTRTAESLVEMVGRVPMKELVRDTTDVIERMCIEAALKLTGDNRASAARVLGLSRQALYLKMNRFGISDEE